MIIVIAFVVLMVLVDTYFQWKVIHLLLDSVEQINKRDLENEFDELEDTLESPEDYDGQL